MLISCCKNTKITTSHWTTINRRMLEPTKKKRYPTSKDKEEAPVTGRRGTIMTKLNSIPTRCDSQAKEQQYQRNSPTIVKVLNPMPGFPACGSDKETGNPQGSWPWRSEEFDYKTSTGLWEIETLVLKGMNKILHAPSFRGKEQWPQFWFNQNYLLVLESLLWRDESARAHHRDGGTGSSSLGKSSLV